MNKEFKGISHSIGPIDLTKHCAENRAFWEYRPIEIHLKENGSITHGPSLCIVMENETRTIIFGQISLEILNEGLSDIGYKIIKS